MQDITLPELLTFLEEKQTGVCILNLDLSDGGIRGLISSIPESLKFAHLSFIQFPQLHSTCSATFKVVPREGKLNMGPRMEL